MTDVACRIFLVEDEQDFLAHLKENGHPRSTHFIHIESCEMAVPQVDSIIRIWCPPAMESGRVVMDVRVIFIEVGMAAQSRNSARQMLDRAPLSRDRRCSIYVVDDRPTG